LTVKPSEAVSRTSPSSAIDDSFCPRRPSFAVTLKVREPFRSSVPMVTPTSVLVPSVNSRCLSQLTNTSSRDSLNRSTLQPVLSTTTPGAMRAGSSGARAGPRLN
jgi:hypothetical protein